jgi:hypothetical protein
VDFERGSRPRNALQGRDGLLGILIVKDRVTLAERAAFHVLACQADIRLRGLCPRPTLAQSMVFIDLVQGFPSTVARSPACG